MSEIKLAETGIFLSEVYAYESCIYYFIDNSADFTMDFTILHF